jgi:divalent metal cation (Fe/Co/Zn/Cd) transporter
MSNVARRAPQVKRLSVAAAPAIGSVPGAVERHRVDARELHSEYLQAESQHLLLDYLTAGFVIMAVVFGPGLAWLLLT